MFRKAKVDKSLIKKTLLVFILMITLSSCGQLESIPYDPVQTPAQWLSSQPHQQVKMGSTEFIIMQPSSTLIVYTLGILTILFGLYYLKNRNNQQSKIWWGIALVLWGIGALLAGTSYQAFSYEIKCAGREICRWTSWWEVFYLIFSAASIDAMMLAMANSSVGEFWKKKLKTYAFIKCISYTSIVLIGAILPNKFMISFELLLLVSAPSIVLFLIINISRYKNHKQKIDLALTATWLALGFIIIIYYVYFMLGFTEQLYQKGIWFSANDVLHIGLICWMLYIRFVLAGKMNDLKMQGISGN